MRLETKRLRDLREILLRLVDHETLKTIVADAERNLEKYSLADKLETVMLETLHGANAEGWLDMLVDGVNARYGADPELKTFLETIAFPGAQAQVDHYTTCYVDNRPFVDRTELRATLRQFTNEDGPR